MKIHNNVTEYKLSPQFKAIKVRNLRAIREINDVIIYNNQTAMFKKAEPFWDGINKLIIATKEHLASKFISWTCLDKEELFKLNTLKKCLNKNTFKDRMLYGVIGSGIHNMALKLDNNEVLCISDKISAFKTREFEDFDLPLKKLELIDKDMDFGWFIRKFGEPVNETELKKLEKQIVKKGYIVGDWRTEQACKINNKIYLIDFECAVKRDENSEKYYNPRKYDRFGFR